MVNRETTMNLPPRWGDDSISAFIDQSFKNILATFVHKKESLAILGRIDACFLRIGENLVNPPDLIAALLLLRSHSAYRGASRLAMSGQLPESFPVLRACLEYSLYALHISENPALGEAWFRRHDDGESMGVVRREFTHTAVMATLSNRDADLHATVQALYERAIDFGGHPNERAVTGSMMLEQEPGRVEIQQIYLHGDSLSLDHGLKSTAQVGLGSLCILFHIFRQRMELLGVDEELKRLRELL